eukprot:5053892-Prymnesium_polylepis.2
MSDPRRAGGAANGGATGHGGGGAPPPAARGHVSHAAGPMGLIWIAFVLFGAFVPHHIPARKHTTRAQAPAHLHTRVLAAHARSTFVLDSKAHIRGG